MRWMERFICNKDRAVYVKDMSAQRGGNTTVRYLTKEEYRKIRPNEAARHIEFIFHKGIALLVDWDIARVLIEKYKSGVTLQDKRGNAVEVTDDLTDLKHRDLMHLLGRYYRGAKAMGIKPPTVSGNYSELRAKIRMLRMMNVEPAEEKPHSNHFDSNNFEGANKTPLPDGISPSEGEQNEIGGEDANESTKNDGSKDQQEKETEEKTGEGGAAHELPLQHEGKQTTGTNTTQGMNFNALSGVD